MTTTMQMSREPAAGHDTRLLDGASAEDLALAAGLLRGGELVVFPTDTVYGVGVLAFDGAAIERLYVVKQRPQEKGIPILLADMADLARVCRSLPPSARILIDRFWPGPLTLIVPRHPDLPAVISPNDAIAVRVPGHASARELIRAAGGAVATSSANLSGQPEATSGQEAYDRLKGLVAAVVDTGRSPHDIASTIVDCTGDQPRLVRQGRVSAAELGLTPPPGEAA